MILEHRPRRSLSALHRLALALGAAGVLLVFPSWAERPSGESATDAASATQAAAEMRATTPEAPLQQGLVDEQHARALEQALHEVRSQQVQLKRHLAATRDPAEAEQLRAEAQRLAVTADRERASALEAQSRELATWLAERARTWEAGQQGRAGTPTHDDAEQLRQEVNRTRAAIELKLERAAQRQGNDVEREVADEVQRTIDDEVQRTIENEVERAIGGMHLKIEQLVHELAAVKSRCPI